jgi:hypothetical protein
MSEKHAEVASRVADAMNMVRAVSVGHRDAVSIPELRDLLVEVEADLQTMTSGRSTIDVDGARQAVSKILRGLTASSWDQVAPEALEAMEEFLANMRADQM